MNVDRVRELAKETGWGFLTYQENIGMISFTKTIDGAPARTNIYLTTMTVATCVDHPKSGKTQLFRRNVGEKLLRKVFDNPRVHTKKGYRKKRRQNKRR